MQNPFDPGYYGSKELRSFGFAHVGDNVQIAKNCTIIGLDKIEIGDNVRIDGYTTIVATGPLTLGNFAHIHSYCQIGARGGVEIGDYAAVASGCLIYSASDDVTGRYMVGGTVPASCVRPKIAPVRMGRHSVLFSRCTVLPGATIGEGGVACANSLILLSVPEWTVVQGSPAIHRLNRRRNVLALEALAAEIEAIAA